MKFTKEKLVEAADYIIDYWADKESRRERAYEEYVASVEDNWIKNYRPKLVEFSNHLAEVLKTNSVITSDMMSKSGSIVNMTYYKPGRNISNFEWEGETFTDKAYARELDYARDLKTILEYCEDGPVMAGDLSKCGFNPKLLAELLQIVSRLKAEREALAEYRERKAKREAEKAVETDGEEKAPTRGSRTSRARVSGSGKAAK